MREIRARVDFLINVGLDYLNLPRATGTLSGGERGGTAIAQGTPEEVAENPNSYTGQYLKKIFKIGAEYITALQIPRCKA